MVHFLQLGTSQLFPGGADFLGGGGSSGVLGMDDVFGVQSSTAFVPSLEVYTGTLINICFRLKCV